MNIILDRAVESSRAWRSEEGVTEGRNERIREAMDGDDQWMIKWMINE